MVTMTGGELIQRWEHGSCLQRAFNLIAVFFQGQFRTAWQGIIFFSASGPQRPSGENSLEFPYHFRAVGRNIWSEDCPSTSRQHRQAGWKGAGRGRWGAVAMATQPAFQNNVSNQENSSRALSLHNPHGQSGRGMHKGDSFFVEKWLFTRPRTKENICCIGSVFVFGWNKINKAQLLSSSLLFTGNEHSFVTQASYFWKTFV